MIMPFYEQCPWPMSRNSVFRAELLHKLFPLSASRPSTLVYCDAHQVLVIYYLSANINSCITRACDDDHHRRRRRHYHHHHRRRCCCWLCCCCFRVRMYFPLLTSIFRQAAFVMLFGAVVLAVVVMTVLVSVCNCSVFAVVVLLPK